MSSQARAGTLEALEALKKSLYLQKRHTCCEQASWFLFPPRAGCNQTGHGKIESIKSWYLNIDRICMGIAFCPWCGIRLESTEQERIE